MSFSNRTLAQLAQQHIDSVPDLTVLEQRWLHKAVAYYAATRRLLPEMRQMVLTIAIWHAESIAL